MSWAAAARRLRVLQAVQLSALVVLGLAIVVATSVQVRELGRLSGQRDRADEVVTRVSEASHRLLQVEVEFFRAKSANPDRKALTPQVVLEVLRAREELAALADAQRPWVSPEVVRDGDRVMADIDGLISLVRSNVTTAVGTGQEDVALARLRDVSPALDVHMNQWVRDLRADRDRESARLDALRRQLERRVAIIAAVLCAAAVLLWMVLDQLRGRIVQELRHASEEQQLHGRVATIVTGGGDLQAVAGCAVEETHRMVEAAATVVAVAEHDGAPRVLAGEGEGGAILDAAMARAMATRAPAYVDGTAGRRSDDAFLEGDATGVALPVVVDGVCWGALGVLFRSRGELVDAQPGLARVVSTLGLAVASVETHRRLSDQASSDPLTGLANHRAFHERLKVEVGRALEAGDPLALVLMDIDHFKAINDGLGHQVGDQVLVDLARRLRSEARGRDLVARVGGEEFAWLMPGATAIEAFGAAERARLSVRSRRMGRMPLVTISAGVASTEDAGTPDELMVFADGALYWSKAHGRDLSCRWSAEVRDALDEGGQDARLAQMKALSAIQSLARAVDARDPYTFRHSERVAALTHRLAIDAGWKPHRAAELREAALLHDVGKVGVPDAVLLKPSALTDDEYELVKQHSALGAQIVSGVLNSEQVTWVRGHHERYAGGGYPDGLCGEDIPEGARLMAVADAWDAMTSDRPYRRGCSQKEAYAVCVAERGRQLCPAAVDALTRLWNAGQVTDGDVVSEARERTG